jgi:hypothetical protein
VRFLKESIGIVGKKLKCTLKSDGERWRHNSRVEHLPSTGKALVQFPVLGRKEGRKDKEERLVFTADSSPHPKVRYDFELPSLFWSCFFLMQSSLCPINDRFLVRVQSWALWS